MQRVWLVLYLAVLCEGQDEQNEDAFCTLQAASMQGKVQAQANIYHSIAHKSSSGCTLPPSLGLKENSHDRQKLLDAVAGARKSTPFLWLHYGDGDVMSVTGSSSFSMEGADLNSQCVRDGLAEMFLGTSNALKDSKAEVYEAVGGFFLCKESHAQFFDLMERFAKAHPQHKYEYSDDFYFPVGTSSSPTHESWVKAAMAANRPTVLVGPQHLNTLSCMLNHKAFFEIPIPTRGCGDVDRLVPKLVKFSEKFPDDSVLFIVAGGSVGKMIAYRAFESLRDKDMFVDVGASLDAYAGKTSRDYNHDLRKFCKESKPWMAYDACEKHCKTIHEDVACQKCD